MNLKIWYSCPYLPSAEISGLRSMLDFVVLVIKAFYQLSHSHNLYTYVLKDYLHYDHDINSFSMVMVHKGLIEFTFSKILVTSDHFCYSYKMMSFISSCNLHFSIYWESVNIIICIVFVICILLWKKCVWILDSFLIDFFIYPQLLNFFHIFYTSSLSNKVAPIVFSLHRSSLLFLWSPMLYGFFRICLLYLL